MSSGKPKSKIQMIAEAEVDNFKKELGPFVVAAETTRMAMVFTLALEPENPIIFANDAFLELVGYGREEVLGRSFNFLMAHAADPNALQQIEIEFKDSSKCGVEVLYRRKDGSEFWAAVFISPVRDETGNIVQYFASFVDLTKHMDEKAQSKMLINELNHRVKNTLATVQSIVWQGLRSTSDPKVVRQAIESRLLALSRSHDHLTRENWKNTGLHDIIVDALEPFTVTEAYNNRIAIEGDNISFPPKTALAISIAFNELATNAIKYGALSNGVGSITVQWDKINALHGNEYMLEWRETGGPHVVPPVRHGFGSGIIKQGLAQELDGEVHMDYKSDGLVCTMSFQAPQVNVDG